MEAETLVNVVSEMVSAKEEVEERIVGSSGEASLMFMNEHPSMMRDGVMEFVK